MYEIGGTNKEQTKIMETVLLTLSGSSPKPSKIGNETKINTNNPTRRNNSKNGLLLIIVRRTSSSYAFVDFRVENQTATIPANTVLKETVDCKTKNPTTDINMKCGKRRYKIFHDGLSEALRFGNFLNGVASRAHV